MSLTDEVLPANQTKMDKRDWSHALNTGSGVFQVVWDVLSNPWLLIASCNVVLVLVLSSIYLHQLPGQLNEDPLAAARWLMTISAEYGPLGDMMRGLGLFNLFHSALLYFLLALIGLIFFVHLGDLISAAWRLRQVAVLLPTQVNETGPSAGVPLPAPTPHPVYRWRQAHPTLPADLAQRLREKFAATFDQVQVALVDLYPRMKPLETSTTEPALPETAPQQEIRLLAIRHPRSAMVRPLIMLGLLLLWFVIWLILILGWAVRPPTLAPGAEYRYAAHELVLQYQVNQQANTPKPVLAIHAGEGGGLQGGGTTNRANTDLPATTRGRIQVGPVEVTTAPGAPGLLLSTETGALLLQRPGQSNLVNVVGLAFPNPGSEESVVLPAQSVVLRIVRVANTEPRTQAGVFAVEIYQGNDKQPVQRLQIRATARETFKLNSQTIGLRFIPLPSLTIEVRYTPGVWLIWPALALILIGAAGFWSHPAFILAQVAPWPENRSVLVIQGDVQNEVEALRQWISGQS